MLIVCPPVINVAKLSVSPTAIPLATKSALVIKKSVLAVLNARPYVDVAAEVAVTATLAAAVDEVVAPEVITILGYDVPAIVV